MREYICRYCGSSSFDEPGICCGAERESACPHGLAKSQCEICKVSPTQEESPEKAEKF